MAAKFWVGGGSSTNWGATAPTNWSLASGGTGDAAVPSTSDDVFFDANSGSGVAVIAAAANCLSATFTGFTGTITHNAFTWTVVKSLTMASGMTYTALTSNANCKITFTGTTSGNTITTAGKILPFLLFSGSGGVWTLQDSIIAQTTTINAGTFNTNSFNCNLLKFVTGAAGIVNLGSTTLTIPGLTTSVVINAATTINFGTSTIVLSNTTNSIKTIDFGGKTIYNLTISANAGAAHKYYFINDVIVGNNLSVYGQNHIQIYATGTITANGTIALNSTSAGIITIDSDSAGTPGNLIGTGGIFYYLNITDNAASGGVFRAFSSTGGGGNTGWFITANPPYFSQDTGGYVAATGSANYQSTGGLSGGTSSTFVQSTGDPT